jgi:prephenate dehydratase
MPQSNQVGILFRILGVFALRDIDLLKIESRPNPRSPFEYWFYVDFAGGVGEAKVDKALDHLREMAADLKILGSYPRAGASGPTKARR